MLLFALTAALVLAADQYGKYRVQRADFRPRRVGRGLGLCRVHNHGLLLRLGQRYRRLVLLLPLAVLLAFALLALPQLLALGRPGIDLCCGLLLGGALGNVLDRCTRGFVVDWISFPRLPGKLARLAFNLADTAILLGALGLAAGGLCWL